MRISPEQLYAFLQSMGGDVWEADTNMQHVNFINDHQTHILGFLKEDWEGIPGFWESRIHPDDSWVVVQYLKLHSRIGEIHSFEYRILSSDGSVKWVKDSVGFMKKSGGEAFLSGVMVETTDFRRLIELEKLEKNVLKLDIKKSLRELLHGYLAGLEELFPQMRCSILKIKNGRLYHGIAPSLPKAYMEAIENQKISENTGSCGTAAALKRQVIVSDISIDSKWDDYREVALRHGLRACWSNPVISSEGDVMATLAMYYNEPKTPTEEELQVMERATALLQIVLENRQKTEIIKETNLLVLQSQDLAHFGNWNWDIEHNIVTWSPALYNIYGLNPNEFTATFEGYLALLHPDDRSRIKGIVEHVLKTGEDAEFEERIIRPNGDVRYLRSWAKRKLDPNGTVLGLLGACLDNTDKVKSTMSIAQQNKKFRDIAWVQSHVVRAPLARIMGLVDLIKSSPIEEVPQSELLDYLLDSANELDEQIRIISQKTE